MDTQQHALESHFPNTAVKLWQNYLRYFAMSTVNNQSGLQVDAGLNEFGNSYSASQWREQLSTQYGLDCKLDSKDRFEGLRVDWQVGDLWILKASVSEQTLIPEQQRTKAELQDSLLIKLFLDGRTRIDGHRDSATFGPGGMVVVDPAACYFKETMEEVRFAVVIVPKQSLRERGIRCDLDTWIKPDLRSPNLSMIREQLLWVARTSQKIDHDLGGRVSDQVIDMMDIVLAQGSSPKSNRGADLTLLRVKELIRGRLSEPGMDAAAIAAATRLSISYLNHLFKSDGKSLMNYLWTLRLERAAQLLSSPRVTAAQVEEIAWQCGFASASHFSRRFREHFGMTPGNYRASHHSMRSAPAPDLVKGVSAENSRKTIDL